MENKRSILLSTKGNGRSSSVAENGEDFKLIPLTQGKFAIVDAEDYQWLSQYKWFAVKSRGEGSIGSYGFSQDMVEFSNLSFHSNKPRVQHLSDKMAEVHQLKN